MTSYLKIEWRYSFAPVESGGTSKNWRYIQNFSFIAPWLQRPVFQYLLNLLCACVQCSASVFRADKSFSLFGFQSWQKLPNFEVICVQNTQLCSKNLFLHINEETLALSHLSGISTPLLTKSIELLSGSIDWGAGLQSSRLVQSKCWILFKVLSGKKCDLSKV